jgi:glutamate dehydrogenase/leucine dehydrogenase
MANAGGVIVSYFEWYQNVHVEHWEKTEVRIKLKEKMQDMFERVTAESVQSGVSLRAAAALIAVRRIDGSASHQ